MHNQIVFELVNKGIVLLFLSIFVTRKKMWLKKILVSWQWNFFFRKEIIVDFIC